MKHRSPVEVRFRDLDALGHVNNAVYATYLEQARIAFFHVITTSGNSWMDVGVILAKLEINFRQPVTIEDQLVIDLHCTHIGNTSFTFAYEIVRESDHTVMASATSVQVCFDYDRAAPKPVPDSWRDRLAEFNG